MKKSVEVIVTDVGDVILSAGTRKFFENTQTPKPRRYKGKLTKKSKNTLDRVIVSYATDLLIHCPDTKII